MCFNLLKNNFTDIKKLLLFLQIDKDNEKRILLSPTFKLNLPYRLAKKIKKNTVADPIFMQFVPTANENVKKNDFSNDPVSDCSFKNEESNLIQKYKNRALLICSSYCAMNCRFCFRQHFEYNIEDLTFKREIEEIKENSDISEIILSGGDPLFLDNQTLKNIIKEIDQIPHVKRIRFHTRLPISHPERIDNTFLNILKNSNKQIFFALHINHNNELDEEVFSYLSEIQKLGIPILTQTVLLKNINDKPEILATLFENLSNHGIIPYYLHQLDKVQNASHFEVSIETGKKIIEKLREKTSGYNVPSYVQEIAHKKNKTPLI